MWIRSLLRRVPWLERRWIPDAQVRDDHESEVRARLADERPGARVLDAPDEDKAMGAGDAGDEVSDPGEAPVA